MVKNKDISMDQLYLIQRERDIAEQLFIKFNGDLLEFLNWYYEEDLLKTRPNLELENTRKVAESIFISKKKG